MGETGTVDDDENVGARFDDVAHGLPNAAQERAQARSHGQVAHHRHVIEGKQGDEALRRHGLATDPTERHRPIGEVRQRPHQLGAELIAGILAGDEPDSFGRRGRHAAIHASIRKPMRNSPARSASATVASLSMMRV